MRDSFQIVPIRSIAAVDRFFPALNAKDYGLLPKNWIEGLKFKIVAQSGLFALVVEPLNNMSRGIAISRA